MDSICYKPIGIGHSPFKEPKRVPIQPIFAEKVEGKIGLFHKYTEVMSYNSCKGLVLLILFLYPVI